MNLQQLKAPAPIAAALLIGFLLTIPSAAQNDPDPNSPTPVLLSSADSTRALAIQDNGRQTRGGLPKTGSAVFDLHSRAILYVTNVALMKGEDATAFRVYAVDARQRLYRFPVLGMSPAD